MGRFVPYYRIALDTEVDSCKSFRDALISDERQAFDDLMDQCKLRASEARTDNPLPHDRSYAHSTLIRTSQNPQKITKTLEEIEKTNDSKV
jgi:hypothetical protein